jgi:hypothetical protein
MLLVAILMVWGSFVTLMAMVWRACNLTAFTPCLTGPMDCPFASNHEGPRFNPQGGTYVKLGFSC